MNWKNLLEGAAYGAALAFVVGQLGPQVATPEEIITVPVGAVLGAIVGAKRIKNMVKI